MEYTDIFLLPFLLPGQLTKWVCQFWDAMIICISIAGGLGSANVRELGSAAAKISIADRLGSADVKELGSAAAKKTMIAASLLSLLLPMGVARQAFQRLRLRQFGKRVAKKCLSLACCSLTQINAVAATFRENRCNDPQKDAKNNVIQLLRRQLRSCNKDNPRRINNKPYLSVPSTFSSCLNQQNYYD